MRSRWLLLLPALALLLGVWALNSSRLGAGVRGCPQGCASVGERESGPLRVLSLNVLHGFPEYERLAERLELAAAEIRRVDADIALLQEVPWTWSLGSAAQYLAERTGLNHVSFRANGNRWTILFEEGGAILSRFPLSEARGVELPPRAGFFEHRIALAATATTPWGEVYVVTTHLTNGDPAVNRAQAQSLEAFVARRARGTAIVGGDFNAREDSPQIEMLAAGWVDAFRAVHPDDPGPTCCVDDLTAGPDEPLEKRIDYLFVVPGPGGRVRVVESRRIPLRPEKTSQGWLWPSDHIGVFAEIDLPAGLAGQPGAPGP